MRVRTLLGPLLLAGAVAIARHRSRPEPERSRPEREPAVGERTVTPRVGSAVDRGRGATVRMDLDRARATDVEPVVEFLTYVQQRRGDRSHLLFVRTDDLDAMAEAADEPREAFLSRLDQLGVVVSTN